MTGTFAEVKRKNPIKTFELLVFVFVSITLVFATACRPRNAGDIRVAVASNFSEASKEIKRRFEAKSGRKVLLSYGSTGKHYAQIANGAPFDLFLASDSEHPKLLEEKELAVQGTRFTYALGTLVLWSSSTGVVDRSGKVLKTRAFKRIAIANPRLAPYGKAALEVLKHNGLTNEELAQKLVRGEDVGQAFQFVRSGNADLGFVADSQVISLGSGSQGSKWIVPPKMYQAIEQQAVLLNDTHAAREFLVFLKSPETLELIRSYGYGTP